MLRFLVPEPCVCVVGQRRDRPHQPPEGQHLDLRNTRGAEKKASGYARGGWGGGVKLPVPHWSCFRLEPEDAECGRNSGLTDGQLAALD